MQPFGRSRVRELILVQLFNHPGAAVHVRELARRIGASPAAVSKELASLQQAGIVSSRRIGRSLQYQMGEGPVAEAARTLFQRTVGVEALLREALTGLPGVEAAFIHGSYASGNQRSDGDVHVIVVGEPDRVEVAERLANAERQIGRPVSLVLLRPSRARAKLARPDAFWRSVQENPTIRLVGPGPEALSGLG